MKYILGIVIISICVVIALLVYRTTSSHLVANYEIDYIDSKENMSIYYNDPEWGSIGIINPTVFAVGFNDDYIIVKQHPNENFKIERGITHYFIIPLNYKLHNSPEDNKIGPLSKAEFLKKRKELGIPSSLAFTEVFKDLE